MKGKGFTRKARFTCEMTIPGQRKTGSFGGEITAPVEEPTTNDHQQCRESLVHDKITVVEKAYWEIPDETRPLVSYPQIQANW